MIGLIISSLLLLFNLICLGKIALKAMKLSYGIVETLLIGLVLCNAITTLFSLFIPLNVCSFLTITSVLVIISLFYHKRVDFYSIIERCKQNKLEILLSLLFICSGFFVALTTPDCYDTSLYHAQAIMWIEQYSVIPGLANLHGRFGFNPNTFTLFAFTSLYDLFGQNIYSVNFVVFIILTFYFVKKMSAIYILNGFSNVFLFNFFVLVIFLRLPNLAAPSPDYLLTSLSLYIFTRTFDLFQLEDDIRFKAFIPVVLLTIYIVTIKLAAIPLLLLMLFILIYFRGKHQKLAWLFIMGLLLSIPWVLRNIITTGWIVYPFPNIDLFDFDWKVPITQVIAEKNSVTWWARIRRSGSEMPLLMWVPIWWQKIDLILKFILLSALIFPLTFFTQQLVTRCRVHIIIIGLVITSFSGCLFWLFLAPDWRFGQSFLVISVLFPLLITKPKNSAQKFMTYMLIAFITCIIGYYSLGKSAILLFLLFALFKVTEMFPNKRKLFVTLLFVFIGLNFWKVSFNNAEIENVNIAKIIYRPLKMKVPINESFTTFYIGHIKVSKPVIMERCYDQRLPCTPFPNSLIVLRGSEMQNGFKQKRSIN